MTPDFGHVGIISTKFCDFGGSVSRSNEPCIVIIGRLLLVLQIASKHFENLLKLLTDDCSKFVLVRENFP